MHKHAIDHLCKTVLYNIINVLYYIHYNFPQLRFLLISLQFSWLLIIVHHCKHACHPSAAVVLTTGPEKGSQK